MMMNHDVWTYPINLNKGQFDAKSDSTGKNVMEEDPIKAPTRASQGNQAPYLVHPIKATTLCKG
jgi:hypothetical protein